MKMIKRALVSLATIALAGGAAVAVSDPASASTIPGENLQLCAQGNYPAFLHVNRHYYSSTAFTPDYYVRAAPGQCSMQRIVVGDVWVQVDVVGLRPDGSQFYIGSQWYDGDRSGMGIGAEGSPSNPYIWQW